MPSLERRHLPAIAVAAVLLLVLAARLLPARGGEAVEIAAPVAGAEAGGAAGGGAPGGAPAAGRGAPGAAGGASGADGGASGAKGGDGATGGAAAPGGELFVHVAGAVRRPGLYRLGSGARVAQAVDLAGGPTRRAELAGVNLAAPLADGQQVVVPRRGEALAAAPGGAGGTAASPGAAGGGGPGGAPLSLATATIEQLDALDGIGPTLARRIVEYRAARGGFRSIEELREVEGIGEKRYEALRRAVRP